MKAFVKSCNPYAESVHPAIHLDLSVSTDSFEALLDIQGLLLASDRKILALVTPFAEQRPNKLEEPQIINTGPLAARSSAQDTNSRQETAHGYSLVALLDKKSLDYVDTMRSTNAKRDIRLLLKLTNGKGAVMTLGITWGNYRSFGDWVEFALSIALTFIGSITGLYAMYRRERNRIYA